jgi:aminoglycoside/choline kinase family phosphotransferase
MELPEGSSLPLSSEELAVFKEPPQELPFVSVQRFLSKVGVRVPKVYGYWKQEGLVLLEDLGDTLLWDRVQGLRSLDVLTWYRKAIDQLLVLQVRGTKEQDDSCIAFQQRFDDRLYMWEFDHFLEYGLRKQPQIHVKPNEMDALRKIFEGVARALASQLPCLNHRDYHSWNLMIRDGDVAIIDFQDALLAPPQYDLASLLNDRETDKVIVPELEEQLINYYLNRREAMGEPRDPRDEFVEIYRLSTIQRDLKVVGRFYYLDLVKGKPGYKKFIPATLRRLKRNLERMPRLKEVESILSRQYREMQ